jgi:DMSO/TMAO reductase YedYZ heme-binding membrane subunit
LVSILILILNLIFYTSYSNITKDLDVSLLLKVFSFENLQFSLSELQKILGLTGLTLISTVVLIESLARINKKFSKYKIYEKYLGIYAFLIILTHVILFFILSIINYKNLSYKGINISLFGFLFEINTQFAIILAWISFMILFFMFITSFSYFQNKIKNWKKFHKLLYLVLFLLIIHMIFIEKGKQIRPFGLLQLYFAIFSFTFLLFSYLVHFVKKIYKN